MRFFSCREPSRRSCGHNVLLLCCIVLQLSGCSFRESQPPITDAPVRLSIIGTNDVHGQLLPGENRGGLVTLSGYVEALRASGHSDGILLVDAGDMWQGTLESNIDEGQPLVAAYNALGYAAATIGNHEFDFGPVGDAAVPDEENPEPRGALRARALEAGFPLLAANLVVAGSGAAVSWDNVMPSTVVQVADLDIGIVGVITAQALQATIAANVADLEVTSLADSIRREAEKLRARKVDLVVVLAHAGGRCRAFDAPDDLSSCDMGGEIFQVANALPQGLVDHIVAGHVHDGIAHLVNGISITSSYSSTRAFSRVDFVFDHHSHAIIGRRVYAPQALCPYQDSSTGDCLFAPPGDGSATRAHYAGQPVVPDPQLVTIAEQARARAETQKLEPSGAWLAAPLTLKGNPESTLGNLFTDALLAEIDADIAIHNVSGGIRASLPAGEVTFGDVYEMFPFDNRVVVLDMSGADLRTIMAAQAKKSRRRAGIAGVQVAITCDQDQMQVRMTLRDGREIADSDSVRVIVNDYLALGGDDILTPALPEGGFKLDSSAPRTRDVIYSWLQKQDRLYPESFDSSAGPRWLLPAEVPDSCSLGAPN